MRNLFGLAPGGVYQAVTVTRYTGELLPFQAHTLCRESARGGHLFTLSSPEGLVVSLSVALSFPLPGLRVTEHLALWSSDFPPRSTKIPRGDYLFCSGIYNEFLLLYNILLKFEKKICFRSVGGEDFLILQIHRGCDDTADTGAFPGSF